MAAILLDSVAVVVVFVMCTHPRAKPLALITTRNQFMDFLCFPVWVWGSTWRAFWATELRYKPHLSLFDRVLYFTGINCIALTQRTKMT